MDEFEKLLSEQPLRTIPPEWKAGILAGGCETGRGKNAASTNGVAWWREWLWPSPVAWAGLACVWLVIIALNFAARPTGGEWETARRTPLESPREIAMIFAQQRQQLAQLLAVTPEPAAEPRRTKPPGPRSERIPTAMEA